MHTILFIIDPGAEVSDFRPQVPDLLGLTDRASIFVGETLIHTFRRVSVSAAGMAWFDTITLEGLVPHDAWWDVGRSGSEPKAI
jgi:hypothetical protein